MITENSQERNTEKLYIGAILASARASQERFGPAPILAGALIGLGIFLLGWYTRELFALPYDYTLLVLVIPITAGLVAWGNAR